MLNYIIAAVVIVLLVAAWYYWRYMRFVKRIHWFNGGLFYVDNEGGVWAHAPDGKTPAWGYSLQNVVDDAWARKVFSELKKGTSGVDYWVESILSAVDYNTGAIMPSSAGKVAIHERWQEKK